MATIDPSIALQVRAPTDPMETYAKGVSLRSLANKQRLDEAQLAKYEQDRADEQKLSDLYRSNVDATGQLNRQGLLGGAAGAGLGSRIPGLQKGFADQDKASYEARKAHIENQGASLKLVGELTSQLASNPNVTTQDVIQAFAGLPPDLVPPDRTAQIVRSLPSDPVALRRQLAAMGASAEARYKELLPQFEKVDSGKQITFADTNPVTNPTREGLVVQRTTTPGEDLSAATARRGQNLTDSRAREAAAAAQFIPVDGVGLYVGDKRTGVARPVVDQNGNPVKPNKALTEGQAKANLFGTRMQESDQIINDLSRLGVNAPSIPQQLATGGIAGTFANATANPQQQQVDQAQRDFINAVLRRESGAAIAPSEFDNARRQYFVQPGDSPQVIAQKARNRQTAIQGMMAEVPEDRRMAAPSISTQAPKVGATQDGYVFMGGDPANPQSWKKVAK